MLVVHFNFIEVFITNYPKYLLLYQSRPTETWFDPDLVFAVFISEYNLTQKSMEDGRGGEVDFLSERISHLRFLKSLRLAH